MAEDSTGTDDRRQPSRLSDDDVKRIAQATRAEFLNGIYQEIGRGIVQRLFWGAVIVGLALIYAWDKVVSWVQHVR